MSEKKRKKIILEDGTEFVGTGFGADKEIITEFVFNTSMVGYQEILSDPSYTDQMVVMTYPLIGNYGMNDDDYECKHPSISGMIVRDYNDEPSNCRCTESLDSVMKRFGIVGIEGIDTRKMTRHLRDIGSCLGIITEENCKVEEALEKIKAYQVPHDAVQRVSTKEIYTMGKKEESSYHVVAIDCGMKENIPRMMVQKGCFVTIVPWDTSAEAILNMKPDGVFVSNGPGDPQDVTATIKTLKDLQGKIPVFGICLGHQMISLSYGAETYKLKFGHRGGNHPVKNLLSDKIEITSQNHSYAVKDESVLNTALEVTHVNLLDNTIEGVRCQKDYVASVQYHPESAPGPQDSAYLFDVFTELMNSWKEKKNA
ncbi:MAG: glutamine-hydrolyzing carbamoyl-phosphate synthase small subunit [Lachnospiraceae bacterium]|nr:glutamine-hydrolyzing carbamoyl-phosphate synthase small subunit [Lachnospiraceae bacterium]